MAQTKQDLTNNSFCDFHSIHSINSFATDKDTVIAYCDFYCAHAQPTAIFAVLLR